MEKYQIERTPDGDVVRVNKSGPDLLRFPIYNKGTGFTLEERRRLGIEGLLPAQVNDIDIQAERIYRSIVYNPDPVGRNIALSLLQNRNEHLFYKVLQLHLEEFMPIVYTPTVGKAAQYFSRVYRRGRGIFITPDYVGRIEQVLRDAAPFSDVRLMVVTDNESILGIGDQGAGGMAISIGKLALYCVGAGIHPAATLPISLDVGTNNQALLDDPFYLGWRKPRLRGADYFAVVDEFVAAARTVFPDVLIQWEDLRKDNALQVLDRYRHVLPSFNDDIQGTGAVATACVLAACRISGRPLMDNRILIYGAGAAGLGIERQLRVQLTQAGLSGDELTHALLVMDSGGMVTEDREHLDEYKRELAWPAAMAAKLGLEREQRRNLEDVVGAYRPTVLIGTSGQGGAFNERIVRSMAAATERPVILPMSNPTSITEARPSDLLAWTDGRALVATGSPFEPVTVDGELRRVGQANNVFVFPGIGLGAIVTRASIVTDAMIGASATALAELLTESDLESECLVPEVTRLWDVCGAVAAAVARQAIEDGAARDVDAAGLEQAIASYRWQPEYPHIIAE
ncbi:MAG: NAD-dependent malic enzyme [Gammaproteobacteria bacterium]|nr:NAD-dependent malic enzyme [Gammaproteobacteria bacterium]MDH4254817.1 NAD-dependent malic enzyme [Gammaproteobacteria bacterium]MDH5309849.1 NAD-dependent malic enzyme [Gammaproteobacteria bacterium]